jgi:hypothetical protein
VEFKPRIISLITIAVHQIRANAAIDSTERLAHVAAFAVSQYASAKYRTVRKPFNPLQGETYELYREDLGELDADRGYAN